MAGERVFISYRRSDSPGWAGRLRDRLGESLGDQNVFFDVDSIDPTLDFREVIAQRLSDADLMVAVIGRDWQPGELADAQDFVGLELREALRQGKAVLPVFVRGASMPSVELFPDDLQTIAYRHGLPLRSDPDFHNDADRIVESIQEAVARRRAQSPTTPSSPTTPGAAPAAAAPATPPPRPTVAAAPPAQAKPAVARPSIPPEIAATAPRGRNPLMLVGLGVLALLLVGGAAFALARGGDDDKGDDKVLAATVEATTAPTEVPTVAPTRVPTVAPTLEAVVAPTEVPTEVPTVEALFACPAGFCVHIEDVEVVDGELVIDWSAHGFEPSVANFHAHFFYDIYEPNQVGNNFAQLGADRSGDWVLTDVTPFSTAGTSIRVAAAPPGTTAICVVPADSGHGVTNPENMECATFPDELLP